MAAIIMEMMEDGQVKNKIINYINENKISLLKKIHIVMMVVIAIIAIILIDIIYHNNKNIEKQNKDINSTVDEIQFYECSDEKINRFINSYFKSRTNLNYPQLFAAFGRDYYKEKQSKTNKESFNKLIEMIRYERTFVKSYDNIKIYCCDGLNEDENVCVVTYDLALGFTDDKAPMIIVFYLKQNDETYIIRNSLDVGVSKYIMKCINTPFIKQMYDDVELRLTRLLTSNESMKLSYNSLRQFEMNMNGVTNYEKNNLASNYLKEELDIVEDADEIRNIITEKKKKDTAKQKLDNYINRVVASMSDLQKGPTIILTE